MRTRDFCRNAQVPDVPQVKFSGIPFRPLSHRERAFSAPPDGLFSLIIMPVPHPHMVLSAAQESLFRFPTHIFTSYPPVLFMPRKTFSLFPSSVSPAREGRVFGKIFLQDVYTSYSLQNRHTPASASCKNTIHASSQPFKSKTSATVVCRNTVLPVILFPRHAATGNIKASYHHYPMLCPSYDSVAMNQELAYAAHVRPNRRRRIDVM